MSIVAVIVGVVVWLGVLCVALGLIGRRRGSEPRCSRCRIDVRPFAWQEHPVCSCGAKLDRFGAVRTGVWRRSRRLCIVGVLLVGLAAGSVVVMRHALNAPTFLAGYAPWWYVMREAEANAPWALAELRRRVQSPSLSESQATRLAVAALKPSVVRTTATPLVWELSPALMHADPTSRDLQEAAADAAVSAFTMMQVDAAPIRWFAPTEEPPDEPGASDAESYVLALFPQNAIAAASFVRIQSITVNGVPALWRLDDDPEEMPWRSEDSRPLQHQDFVRLQIPASLPPTKEAFSVEIRGEWGISAIGDLELILDREEIVGASGGPWRPVWTWNVPVFGQERTARVQCGGPDASAATPSTGATR